MTQRDESDTETGSDFGAGVVICLAKFSEHLSSRWGESIRCLRAWQEATEDQRDKWRAEALRYPQGDSARMVSMANLHGHSLDPMNAALSLWANGASDHFYDLDLDLAPAPLAELATLTLAMGHGFGLDGQVWTWEHWLRIWELWEAACVELDKRLGVEAPDWGRW